ncbi:hypothetical protein [Neobacillus citreus]|uniref:CBS domain-containing protein n=1 Tax=Neobacillus citreus TaxID=2833578 RepID=A0A942YB71_9BACI|nr:hypothetical protein [Neobacillus citreus]MCH6268214.1 hypothetical protein [Neobacillus citreus]
MTTLQNQKLSERFEVAFNQIHAWLQRNIVEERSDKFTDLLRSGFPRHSIIRKYYHDLKMFARLRNSIVHDKVELGFYIAEPHETVVDKIELIAELLVEPKAAYSIASKPVFYYYENAKLKDILTVIQKKSVSLFPIYDETGFKWLLTAEEIIGWFANHLTGNSIVIDEVEVKELFSEKRNRRVEFVGKDIDIFEVEEIFEQYHLKNQKLEAVIITETGEQQQKPLAIVTSWDLVEIDAIE